MTEVTWPEEVTLPEVMGNDVTEVCSAHAGFPPRFFSYYSSSTKCTIVHDWHCYRMWRDRKWRDRKYVLRTPFILVFSNIFEVFRYVVQYSYGAFYHVRVLTVVFLLNNLRVKRMKWYRNSHCCMYNEICKLHCLWN